MNLWKYSHSCTVLSTYSSTMSSKLSNNMMTSDILVYNTDYKESVFYNNLEYESNSNVIIVWCITEALQIQIPPHTLQYMKPRMNMTLKMSMNIWLGDVGYVRFMNVSKLLQSPLNSQLVLSSYVFDMHSTYFRNAIYLAITLVYVLGKRRCDEKDETVESPYKWRCIRPLFWPFDEFWVDSESEDKDE